MGKFLNKDKFSNKTSISYDSILKLIVSYLANKYNLNFSYEIKYNEEKRFREHLEIILKEDDRLLLNISKDVNLKQLSYFYKYHNYQGTLEEFYTDFKRLFDAIPELNNVVDKAINSYNESLYSTEKIALLCINPGYINLKDIYSFTKDEEVIINKYNFFDFLVSYMNEMENDSFKLVVSDKENYSISNRDYGKGNIKYRAYDIMNNKKSIYHNEEIHSYMELINGAVSKVSSNLDEYISLEEALEVINNLKKDYSYLWFFSELLRTCDINTEYTALSLANLTKDQYYKFN